MRPPSRSRACPRQSARPPTSTRWGAIFYRLLTGRAPFQAATAFQTLEQVKTADPVPPSRLQPGLSRDAETICLKCLEKDPRRRYADAAALADDLNRFLAGRTILARPTSAVEHSWKWARRRPAVALLSAAVAAVTVLGFILVSWQWRRAENKAAAESAANERAQQARLVAFEKQAQLTLHQALALCDQGEVGRGLLWLARSLELATKARSEGLYRPIRINLADWARQLSRPRRLLPMRHSGPILGLAFCREGRVLVSVGKDGVARIWDVATGKELEPSLALERDPSVARLERVRFGPAESGLLGAVDHKGKATVLGFLNLRRPLASPAPCPRGRRIKDIVFPDPQSMVTCDNDGIVRWWDTTTHRRLGVEGSPEQGRRGNTMWALSADGRTLVAGGQDRRVLRWDVATRRPLGPELHLDTPVVVTAVTPDGRKVITGGRAGGLHIWNAETERGFDLPPQANRGDVLGGLAGRSCLCLQRLKAGSSVCGIPSLLGPTGQTSRLRKRRHRLLRSTLTAGSWRSGRTTE